MCERKFFCDGSALSFIRQIMQIQTSPSRREGAVADILNSPRSALFTLGSTPIFMLR
jgi:hypothetical protein